MSKYAAKSYLLNQECSGFQIGDLVRVTRKAHDYERGWCNTWPEGMDECVGKTYIISDDRRASGISLRTTGYSFPFFVLEKVNDELQTGTEETEQSSSEAVAGDTDFSLHG